MSPEDTTRITVGFHQSLDQLFVLCSSARSAAGNHCQMVQPIVFVLLVGHQQVRGALVSREDADRSFVRTFGVPFLAVAIRNVLDFLYSGVSHVYLSNRILKRNVAAFIESHVARGLFDRRSNTRKLTVSLGHLK